jgi:hypothetical protein
VRLLVEHGDPHLADLPRAELLDALERVSRVGDVVGDQDLRVLEVDDVGRRREIRGTSRRSSTPV